MYPVLFKNAIISVTIYNDCADKSFWPILIFSINEIIRAFQKYSFLEN